MVMVCLMEQKNIEEKNGKTRIIYNQDKSYFHSETYEIYESTDEKVILSIMIYQMMENLANYLRNGSNWRFKELIRLEIYTVDFDPMKASSYIPLPDFLMRKKAIINILNKDEKCFLWSVLRYLHPKENHEERLNDLRKYENDLNFKGIDFPVKLKDITKFENQNPDLPGINVFSINDNNKIYPLRLNQKDTQKTIDLFLSQKMKNDIIA